MQEANTRPSSRSRCHRQGSRVEQTSRMRIHWRAVLVTVGAVLFGCNGAATTPRSRVSPVPLGIERISREMTKSRYGAPRRVQSDVAKRTERWWYFAYEGLSSGWEGMTPKSLEWFVEFPMEGTHGMTSGTDGRRFMVTEVTDR